MLAVNPDLLQPVVDRLIAYLLTDAFLRVGFTLLPHLPLRCRRRQKRRNGRKSSSCIHVYEWTLTR